MLVYKALYKKMMDDLKDAGMWIDWAEQLRETHLEVANYLLESAKSRLEEDFPKTFECFREVCDDKKDRNDICTCEIIHDQLTDWHNSLMHRIEYLMN